MLDQIALIIEQKFIQKTITMMWSSFKGTFHDRSGWGVAFESPLLKEEGWRFSANFARPQTCERSLKFSSASLFILIASLKHNSDVGQKNHCAVKG